MKKHIWLIINFIGILISILAKNYYHLSLIQTCLLMIVLLVPAAIVFRFINEKKSNG